MFSTLKTLYQRRAARRVFRRWARSYARDVIATRYSAAAAVREAVLPHLWATQAITDLGIGTGLIWEGVEIDGETVLTGLDISPAMLEQASGNPAFGPLYQCDVARQFWPIADMSQDIVTAAGLFEYLTEKMARHVFAE